MQDKLIDTSSMSCNLRRQDKDEADTNKYIFLDNFMIGKSNNKMKIRIGNLESDTYQKQTITLYYKDLHSS